MMFKFLTVIEKNIKQFSIIFEKLVYISFDNDSEIHNHKCDILDCYLLNDSSYENDPFADLFFVNTEKITSRLILSLNQYRNSKIGNSLKEIKGSKLIVITNDENGASVLGLFDFEIEKLIWKTTYFSGATYLGNSSMYVANINENFSNYIYALNLRNGSIKWSFLSETGLKFQNLKFIVEYDNVIYFYNKDNRKIKSVNSKTGNLVGSWQFKSEPIFYGNSITSFSVFHEVLSLETLKFKSVDIRQNLENESGLPWHEFEALYFITNELGFIARRKEIEAGGNAYMLYAFDLENYKLVWSHKFDNKYMKNFRDMQFVDGKLYFLRGDGSLHIFEKEN